jgi:four helix bundle protein
MGSSGAAPKKVTTFQDLIVWQKSMDLIEALNEPLQLFPKFELFVLNAQMRKSALSIPSNIFQGHDRRNKNEFLHFLGIARGSLAELQTQILVAGRLRYWPKETVEVFFLRTVEISKMLNALMKSLQRGS